MRLPTLRTERLLKVYPSWDTRIVVASSELRPLPIARAKHIFLSLTARSMKNRDPRLFWRRIRVLMACCLALTAIVTVCLVVTKKACVVNSCRSGGDPLSGIQMFVDTHNSAAQAEASLERSAPSTAALLRKIVDQPTGIWFGSWNPTDQVASSVRTVMSEAAADHSVPLLVLYAFPYRGCTDNFTAALDKATGYEQWIAQVVVGIGTGKAIVILEPDALAQYVGSDCLSPTQQRERIMVIRRAVDQLSTLPNAVVYLDAGNSRWQPVKAMASLLRAADIVKVRGFSLNVSNFYSTAKEESYGDSLSAMLHGVHYVIDTSRNGTATAKTWCNPPGQALGVPPTASTGNPLVDALLWIKPPWASDGTCNGGPPAGMFWLPYAVSLAANARR